MLFRAEGLIDGAESIENAAWRLERAAAELRDLERQGFALEPGEVENDQARLTLRLGVVVPVRLPYAKVRALLATALGVCGYWCKVISTDHDQYSDIPTFVLQDGCAVVLRVTDPDNGNDWPVKLDLAAVQRGLRLMLQSGENIPNRHAAAFLDLSSGGDNETADVFLQLALLGNIDYSR